MAMASAAGGSHKKSKRGKNMRHPDTIIHNGKTLTEILRLHGMWLRGEEGGERANLAYAILTGANLAYANLAYAVLTDANLTDANLTDAILTGAILTDAILTDAILTDADLRCSGDMRRIKTMQIEHWHIGYTHDTLQVGCQRHPIEKWRKWDTEAGRVWIARMDEKALDWADRHLGLVLQIIDASPAEA
jgi:hypothetical protein